MPRIFKQLGHGYGASPVAIVAQIDGNTVFSGTIPTTNATVPGVEPGVQLGLDCFSWTESTADFAGTRSLSIAVSSGVFQIGETLAQSNAGNSDQYGPVYTANVGGVIFSDPLTDVIIGGSAQTRPSDPELPGQWGWTIPAGATLTATLNINTVPTGNI